SSESQDINHPEYLIIDVVLPSTVHILLSAIYRRPQGHLLDNFFVQFNKFYSTYNNIVIMGDLNCNLLKSDRPANHLKSFIAESNLHCIPYGATFHTTETHSWLDVIIVDSKDKLGNYSKSLRPFIGGHDYLVCNYKLELTSKYDKTVKFRNFNRCDHIALSTDLTQKLYIAALNLEDLDPNYLVSHLITSTTSALDTHAPFTTRRLTRPSSPWLTKELRTEFHQRDILYKRARRTRDTNLMILYKKMRKDLKNKLNTARDTYFKSLLENPSQNSNIWSNLKRVGFLKSKKSSPLDHLNANELNCYYANILRKHPSCTLDFIKGLPSHTVRKVDSIFNWSNVDIVEVTKNLKLTLQKSKGRSPDGLDLKWLKDHIPQISIFLMNILNRSLDTGIFPDAWKLVFIIPHNKINPPKSMSDTRPIANISHLAKVFERIVANQIMDYLETNDILDTHQSGFRKHHSTQAALLLLTDDIRKAIDHEELTYMILFDFSKAFDLVNPAVVYTTMYEIGFSIEVIIWFLSYLTGRSQAVLDPDCSPSDVINTTSGVPQGSILGPILFLIVINEVAKRFKYAKYGLYADDIYTYYHFKISHIREAANMITTEAQAVVDWAKEVGLVINFEKTKVMVLGNSMKLKVLENSGLPQIVIDGKIIPYVSSAKHLGVHLSNNLSWDVHIAQITRKVYATLKNLKHRKSILSSSTRKILITATVIPNIEYCSLVLIDSSKRLDYKLQCLMNNAVRFIFNLKRDEHITPYRCSLNWLTIKSKRSYNLACFFYKLINSGEPKLLRDLF
ncbi:GSCOCG00011978001-RA-CDS, partial [Cotesia congregata]